MFYFIGQVHLTYDDIELLQLASIHFENGDFRAYAYNSFGLVTSVSSSSGTTLKLETCQTSSLTDDPSMVSQIFIKVRFGDIVYIVLQFLKMLKLVWL